MGEGCSCRGRGQVLYSGWEVPQCFFWVVPNRSIPKPDQQAFQRQTNKEKLLLKKVVRN